MTERRQLLQDALAAIERLEARLRASEEARCAPVAIVGAGCRYPGGVVDRAGLWRLLRDGVDAVSEVPPDRWDAEACYSPDPKAQGKSVTRRGGFVEGIDRFEPGWFGISPREAAALDPQQRLLLETAAEALQEAGIATDRLSGTATGVFVGISTSDYAQLMRSAGAARSDVYAATGGALNAAAGRIAFTFGLQGPCVAVDTACSSSLVAVHLACQSLRAGESDLALAGGVNAVLSPDGTILFSRWGMMAPDGKCKTFDAAADGFVRSEGCAVLALERLDDALAKGHPVLAVVRGSAVNSDGRSSGLTVPSGPAQQAVIRKALASARLTPSDVDYVEAHGTGTSLGDPIELEALGAVMRERPAGRPLLVGSVKTNLGHAEAASGLAGLLKVVESLRHELVPAHLHFRTPNPAIPWAELPVRVASEAVPWPRGARPRRAGVSSFGFSGTNAHVVLEEAPAPRPAPAPEAAGSELVAVSARSEAGLREVARRTAEALSGAPAPALPDVALTLGAGRAHHAQRLALVVDDRAALERELRAFAADGSVPAGAARGVAHPGERPRVAFLFTGQGAQYAGMGRALHAAEPVFRAALDRAAAALAPHLDRPLLEVLFDDGAPLGQTAYTQPALVALEWALAQQWRAWGVEPTLVLGHSVGEYAAACVAGALELEEALALVAQRGALMQALPAGGAMAAVMAPEARVAPRLARWEGALALAAVNGPEETVVSGDARALSELVRVLGEEGVQARRLDVSHAFHSPLLDPMLDAFERRAAAVAARPPRLALVSNLTGAPLAAGAAPDARYWRRHAREPVRFAACVEALRAAGATALVEVGPHPILLGLAARCAPGAPWTLAASLRRGRDDRRELRAAAAALYARGVALDWEAIDGARARGRVVLPTYPFERERHWFEAAPARPAPAPGHPLLGERRDLATLLGAHVWEAELGLDTHPWLADHRVQGEAVVPATAYLEMALAAAREVLGDGAVSVTEVVNANPLVLRPGERRRAQTTFVEEPGAPARFTVHARQGEAFVPVMTARVARWSGEAPPCGLGALQEARTRCPRRVDGGAFRGELERAGNAWGPAFQGLREAWIGEGEAVGRVEPPDALDGDAARYLFHPALADACGHALVALALAPGGGAVVGGGSREVRFHRAPAPGALWAHARLRPAEGAPAGVVVGDVRVIDAAGDLVCEIMEARLRDLDAAGAARRSWFHEPRWVERALEGPGARASAAAGTWIALCGAGRLGDAIAEARARAGARTMVVREGADFALAGDRGTLRPERPEDVRSLVEAVGGASALVDLRAADGAVAGRAVERLLATVQGLAAGGARPLPRLWIVTRDAQAVAPGDTVGAPLGAALWGLGRAVSVEHAALWGGLVDLPARGAPEDDARALVAEVAAGGVDDLVALRRARHVARLSRRVQPAPAEAWRPRSDGTYLVTGGLGGIGLAVAAWLVDRGVRHLLLVGRRGLTAGGPRGAVERLRASGAEVEVAAIDVAEEGPLERCLKARQAAGAPPVAGVVHAAGVVRVVPLAEHPLAEVHEVLRAKVDGARRLDALFPGPGLDLFLLCSSGSALLRSALFGVYAAGNAFLDALAHARRARGAAALSVDWGAWGEVGMAVESSRGRAGATLAGVGTLPTAGALAALGELLAGGATQAAVMAVDWAALARAYPAYAADPYLEELIPSARGEVAAARGGEVTALRGATGADRDLRIREHVRAVVARALGVAPPRLDPAAPLSGLGFDSLMAVQVKNQLEADLGAVLPLIRLLRGPTVEELAQEVAGASAPRPAPAEPAWEEGTL